MASSGAETASGAAALLEAETEGGTAAADAAAEAAAAEGATTATEVAVADEFLTTAVFVWVTVISC